jgi:hypothetical protein
MNAGDTRMRDIEQAARRINEMDYPDHLSREDRIQHFADDAEFLAGQVPWIKQVREYVANQPWREQVENYIGEADQNGQAQTRSDALSSLLMWIDGIPRLEGE